MNSKYSFNVKDSYLKTYRAELILFIVTCMWGLSFPLIKVSLDHSSPVLFNFIRFLITLIVFILVYRNKIVFSNFKEWKYGVILGLFLFAGFAFQTIGLKYTSASKSAFITGISLIIIPFAQYMILKKKPKTENIAGVIIVMAGLYILTDAYFKTPGIGDVLTLFCAVFFAFHVVYLDKYSGMTGYIYLLFGQFLTMVVLNFLFMMFYEVILTDSVFIDVNSFLLVSLLYTSLFSTLICIVLMTKYQSETTPVRAGIIYSMESVFATVFSYFLLNEIFNNNQIAGIIIMLAGLFISEFYSYFKLKFKSNEEI
ncbi:MAG: DMT family transporter [Ignavibacteria bacterium]|nr:DMT family transporter [Ignavibacteria bacterium]MBK9405512.1 DMT family transporter [Ignavibacteria bacterium]MBL0106618.1 DMT family transporter [Ignavibacteria bacterium]